MKTKIPAQCWNFNCFSISVAAGMLFAASRTIRSGGKTPYSDTTQWELKQPVRELALLLFGTWIVSEVSTMLSLTKCSGFFS